MGTGRARSAVRLRIRSQKVRQITGNPTGSREERRAAKRLGVTPDVPVVDWDKYVDGEEDR